MFDTQTLEKTKSIDVQGRPDGILFEPFTQRVYVFSHQAPSITVIDPKDGAVVGTIEVGGAMEQAQRDGTLTIIKENSPTSFEIEQTVQTKPGCKTSSLDLKNNRIVLVCIERTPQAASGTPA